MWIISGIMEFTMWNDDATAFCLLSSKTAKQWRHKIGQKDEKYDERKLTIFSQKSIQLELPNWYDQY